MTAKLDPFAAAPKEIKAWYAASTALADVLEPALVELVKMRASQLNACANCLNMHSADARALGESEQRLMLLTAWREAPCYTPRERAALAWTEAMTTLSQGHSHAAAYADLAEHFTPQEQVQLTLHINIINGWNRLAVGFDMWLETPATKARDAAHLKAAA
jgi:AhpD family alkylhydroperoxidase